MVGWLQPMLRRIEQTNQPRPEGGNLVEIPGGIDKLFPDTPEGWLWSASATIEAGPVNIHSYDSVMRGRTSENEERLDGLHGWVIDGLGPDGISARVLDVTRGVVRLQTGYLYHYAFAMLIGVAVIITWYLVGGVH